MGKIIFTRQYILQKLFLHPCGDLFFDINLHANIRKSQDDFLDSAIQTHVVDHFSILHCVFVVVEVDTILVENIDSNVMATEIEYWTRLSKDSADQTEIRKRCFSSASTVVLAFKTDTTRNYTCS